MARGWKGLSRNIGKPRKQGRLHKKYILQEFDKIPQAQTKLGWNWANLENKVDFLRRILYGSLTKCHKLGSGWPEIVGSENIPTVEKTKLWF